MSFMRSVRLCVFFIVLAGGMSVSAQTSFADDKAISLKEASAAYEAKDWQKAARLYQGIAEGDPRNPRMWYRLAFSLHELGEHAKSIEAYKKSMEAGLPPAMGEYQIAQDYAALKENDKSLEFLQKAADHGYNQPEQLDEDSEFGGMHGDARFAKIVKQAQRNQKPCAYTPENRQFDFWLGEWNVVTTQGATQAGSSKIELILGDCVVQENWTGGGGGTGKSYNIYNLSLKRWEQYWVDSSGGNIFFYGGLKEGVMDYWTDAIPQPDGTTLKRHLQFIKIGPDTVRQFSQGSKDDGKTWSVEYDFTYNRKK